MKLYEFRTEAEAKRFYNEMTRLNWTASHPWQDDNGVWYVTCNYMNAGRRS